MHIVTGVFPSAFCLNAPLPASVSAGLGAVAMAAPPPLLDECRCATATPTTMCIPEAIDSYMTRRLKCLCRLTGVTDVTTVVMTNTEAKFQAVEHIMLTI
eukprot:7369090-Lingulodinium_polyedra.AAC.1